MAISTSPSKTLRQRNVLPAVGSGGSDVPLQYKQATRSGRTRRSVTRKNGRVERHKGASAVVLALASHLASAVAT
ncbi:MAG: hypothetical protein V7K92_30755 [Nostoc sp.]|uniref:hypothetical protein n=1 Tax=Nostoc sp. TaxID=1180 RepID=UPI002FEECE5B